MDPIANITEQREIAQRIVARPRTIKSDDSDDPSASYSLLDSAQRLAELVLAQDAKGRGAHAPYLVTGLSKLTGVTNAGGQFSLAFDVGPSPIFTDLGEGETGRALIFIDADGAAGVMRAIAAHFSIPIP